MMNILNISNYVPNYLA